MAKHTPGLWTACNPGDYSDFDGRSSVILGNNKRLAVVQGDDPEAIANARLMASAPVLLEVLQLVRKTVNWQHIPIETRVSMDIAFDKATGSAA